MSIVIDMHNRHAKLNGGMPWYPVTVKGQTWQDMDGNMYEMFPIKIFADAIGRSSRQVRLWDKDKKIPAPLFAPEGEKCKRWYSASQIINCNRIYRYRYYGHKTLHERTPDFFADIKSIWYARDVVVTIDGLINGR